MDLHRSASCFDGNIEVFSPCIQQHVFGLDTLDLKGAFYNDRSVFLMFVPIASNQCLGVGCRFCILLQTTTMCLYDVLILPRLCAFSTVPDDARRDDQIIHQCAVIEFFCLVRSGSCGIDMLPIRPGQPVQSGSTVYGHLRNNSRMCTIIDTTATMCSGWYQVTWLC